MRKSWLAGGAVALALGLVGFVNAADETKEPYDVKTLNGCVEGAIVKMFKPEKVLEFKVEKLLSKTDEKATPKGDERKVDEKAADALKGADQPKEGEIIFLHVENTRVIDENGKELKREDKSAWFSRDQGWAALKDGQRLKVEYTGTHMMPAPKGFPRDARAGGNILVYHVTTIHILNK
ncbi:MAG: hypothetical protein ACAI25_13030 [Planctomycetota bacterium]